MVCGHGMFLTEDATKAVSEMYDKNYPLGYDARNPEDRKEVEELKKVL